MAQVYSAHVTASFDQNADKLAIEIAAAANTTIKIKKIRVSHGNGTGTATTDYYKSVKLVRESAGGSGGTAYTPVKLNASSADSTATVKTGPFTVGTITDTINVFSVHSGTDFLWSAADEDDKITVAPGGIFAIVVNPAAP